MIDQREQAERIQATINTPGWVDIVAIFKEHINTPRQEVLSLLESDPDSLTGKTAIAKANRAKGVEDLLEDITDKLKTLLPTRSRGGA